MNAYNFLSFVQNEYDFARANAIMSEINLKNCWKHWMTAELVHLYNQADGEFELQTDVYYPAAQLAAEKKEQQESMEFLRYQNGKAAEPVAEKRLASRADFSVKTPDGEHYFEIRCGNKNVFSKSKDLLKVESDMQRIEALKKANPELNITVAFAFFGAFENKEIEAFKALDNSTRCSYLLDTAMTGSGSIARLCQMQRAGNPRLCLAAYAV
ncbi:hypothetical protein SG34_023975 [Thalassomonas viridans]|uniref:Uncharacterized protein n=1 Tax=Thalassomonas viridans TaxID=137584 RepID=A0AAF0C8N3_9GAMM|nr:hypothetical protein [Thalassomonas viridans]WDE04365.1 hypothetical protein SG34_023975 [Thalassomonas viridans]